MFKRKLSIAIGCLLAAASATALAGHGSAGAAAGSAGGMSVGHMSSSGLSNSNGPEAADRDKGLARAEDRRSASGTSHEKAQHAGGKTRHHHRHTTVSSRTP